MKKWAPFSSLIEQKAGLDRLRKERAKIPRPTILPERREKIDRLLQTARSKPLLITYYQDGEIKKQTAVIKKIDVTRRCLLFDEEEIPFKDLLDLEDVSAGLD